MDGWMDKKYSIIIKSKEVIKFARKRNQALPIVLNINRYLLVINRNKQWSSVKTAKNLTFFVSSFNGTPDNTVKIILPEDAIVKLWN